MTDRNVTALMSEIEETTAEIQKAQRKANRQKRLKSIVSNFRYIVQGLSCVIVGLITTFGMATVIWACRTYLEFLFPNAEDFSITMGVFALVGCGVFAGGLLAIEFAYNNARIK